MSEQLPAWRMNDAGAILPDTSNMRERLTMIRFNDTPLFKQCILEANTRANLRQTAHS